MTPGQRVLLNTIATYSRTMLSVVLGLFSGRWILQALGEVDYGLMGVVGGLIGFVTVLNGIVSGTCSRFFALSIGKGDKSETKLWFNTALTIHTMMPTVLVLIGWPIGEWAILNFCNIPPERLSTAQWVFRLSLVSAFISMMSAPYTGMLMAKQRIAEVSMWSVCQTVSNFIFVFWLLSYRGDAWMVYALGQVTLSVVFVLILSYRSRTLYEECHFDKSLCMHFSCHKKIFSFAAWQLFGGLTGIFRGNLIAILVNKYFPPTIYPAANASMQIGGTISSHTQTLATALNGALSPEITSTEGRGDRTRMLVLSDKASKFSSFLVLLFAVPISVEIKEILALWLVVPPESAWIFALLYLLGLFFDNLTTGYMIAVNAVGKIAKYQATVGGILLSAFPLAWLFVAGFNLPYISVGAALTITTALASTIRALWARTLVGADLKRWIAKVVTPCFIVLVLGCIIGHGVKNILPYSGLIPMLVVLAVTFAAEGLLGYCLVLDSNDKQFFLRQVQSLKSKIKQQ